MGVSRAAGQQRHLQGLGSRKAALVRSTSRDFGESLGCAGLLCADAPTLGSFGVETSKLCFKVRRSVFSKQKLG